jgi:lysophospholipase L1-like esterase
MLNFNVFRWLTWLFAGTLFFHAPPGSELCQAVAEDATATMPRSAIATDRLGQGNWKARHEAINARVKQGNVDLIMLGDSITHFWDKGEEGDQVWEKYFGGIKAANLAIAGDCTQHLLWRLQNGNLEGISPKLAVMMIGTNNTRDKNTTGEEIAEGIKANLDCLREKLPDTKVLLLAVFPRDEKDSRARKINSEANEIIAQIADDKTVFYLDLGPKFLSADGSISREIMPDLLHLSPEGYVIWAEAMLDQVYELLEQPRPSAKTLAGMPISTLSTHRFEDRGWKMRFEAMNEKAKAGGAELILVGDSITEGWEDPKAQEVWQAHFKDIPTLNLGIGGDTTQNVLWRLDHGNLEGVAPKVAVLMIGTNNTRDPRTTGEQIAAGITAIVYKLRYKLPGTKILLLAIFPRNEKDNPKRLANARASELISKLANNRNIFYLDLGPKFLSPDGSLSKEIMPDLLHLSPKGYEIWATGMEGKLRELLK